MGIKYTLVYSNISRVRGYGVCVMAVKVVFVDGSIREVDASSLRVGDLVRRFGLLVEEHIIVVNGHVVTEDYVLRDGDEVKLYPVVSGG